MPAMGSDASPPAQPIEPPPLRQSPEARVFAAYVAFTMIFSVAIPWWLCSRYDVPRLPQDFFRMTAPGGDYMASYAAARALLVGRDIYRHYPDSPDPYAVGELSRYSYPPLQARLLAPLAVVPFEQSLRCWQALTIGLILVSLFFASRLFPRPWLVFFAGALIYGQSTFLLFQLERGQTDALPLTCMILSIYFALKRRNSYLAGACCAIGAALKVIPAVLVLFFLLRRDWRAVLSAALVGAVLVLASGPAEWWRWWFIATPALRTLFVGSGVDHSLIYLIEGATWDLPAARAWTRGIAAAMLAAYVALVLLNRLRERTRLLELAILTTIVEIVTPWSINYKLVMVLLFFVAPFAALQIDAVRRRPVHFAVPLLACFVLMVPIFGEYLTRIPFTLLANWSGAEIVGPSTLHPFISERRVAVAILAGLLYLFALYAAAALSSWFPGAMRLEARRRAFAWLAAVSPGLALLAVFALQWPTSRPRPEIAAAIDRFGEPRRINEFADLIGCVGSTTPDGGRCGIDLILRSHGPMPRNLCFYLHALEFDAEGRQVATYGANFLPSVITSYWPRDKTIVLRTNFVAVPGSYALNVGLFDLADGSRCGEAQLGIVDFSAP